MNLYMRARSFSNDDTVNQYSPPQSLLTNRRRKDTVLPTNHRLATLCQPMRARASHVNTDHQTTQLSRGKRLTNITSDFPKTSSFRGFIMKGVMFNIDNGYLEGLCRGFKNGKKGLTWPKREENIA